MATSISEINRQITIRNFIRIKPATGIPIKVLSQTQTDYAKVKQITNSYFLQQLQVQFQEAYEVTLRYEPSRVFYPTSDILYQGKVLVINGIRQSEEGSKRWTIITAYTTNNEGEITLSPVVTNVNNEIHVKGSVPIGGSAYAGWTGKIIAFRDSLQFEVKRDGSAADKEINYDMTTGLFYFPPTLPDLTDNEAVDIYFFL